MIKVIELFAGVGSQTQALKNIGVEHEVVGIAEIDKYAISSYMQLHRETHNFGDISKIENLPGSDLWTYSFPCQDLTNAGRGAGIKEGTRSGLLFEVERLLETSEKPKYLLMENVKNLVGKKHKPDFDRWCQKLEELGYKNYWQILNAKDYGIPQNRERVFMVSILGEHEPFIFPEKEELKIQLLDLVEKEVDPGYYLKEQELKKYDYKKYDNYITVMNNTKLGYIPGSYGDYVNLQFPNSNTRRGRIIKGCSATLMCNDGNGVITKDLRIRKLTSRECWRLMGWKDEEFDKIQGISNSQLYKQAGNGIVVTVLEKIFKNMF